VKQNLIDFRKGIKQLWPQPVAFFYAIKANAHPAVLEQVVEQGYGMECGGVDEVDIAIRTGSMFVVNGSGKSTAVLRKSAEHGGLINIDNTEELEKLIKLNIPANIALRLKLVFAQEPKSQDDFYFPPSFNSVNSYLTSKRWGMSISEIDDILKSDLPKNLTITGVHIHLGKLSKSLSGYRSIAFEVSRQLNQLEQRHPGMIKVLNLGGGWNSSNPEVEPNFSALEGIAEFLAILKSKLELSNLPELIFEPGQAIASSAAVTVSKVTATKLDKISNQHWTHLDASTMTTNPVGTSTAGSGFQVSVISSSNAQPLRTKFVGAPCMGSALARELEVPTPMEGDFVIIWDTGAYTFGLQNDFNGYSAATTYLVDDLIK
jgi:diaminopimelate decarboxylase